MRLKILFLNVIMCTLSRIYASEETWTGRWLPERTTEETKTERVPMGIANADCDNAETKIQVDWFDDVTNYTCYDDPTMFNPNFHTRPLIEKENIPPMYKAPHVCINEIISYSTPIPTFGSHRPLWPQWGEYVFLPIQRWVHNLEHGGIVMLYHPCANKAEVNILRKIVAGCMYRYVITPYTELSPARPLALVAWGARLQMSAVDQDVVVEFIKKNALKGPEQLSKDGQYNHELKKHAKVVSTIDDATLCPNF